MLALLLTAVLNFPFPQILELMLEDRVALCMGQMEVRMALTYWILSSSVQGEVTAHKKTYLLQIPLKARDQVQLTGGEKSQLCWLYWDFRIMHRGEGRDNLVARWQSAWPCTW